MQLNFQTRFIHTLLPAMVFILIFCQLLCMPSESVGYVNQTHRLFMEAVIDYREELNPLFRKRLRKRTRYIIVHTSECDLKTTLKIVSKGKQDDFKWVSRGGHTHYVIARNGQAYRILDEKFQAHHAGRSMWNGERNLNRISIGIELVGYHDGDITDRQYESLRKILTILKDAYRLEDRAVLTHQPGKCQELDTL